ncbi:O-acetyl-ADP-ribose deacetylase (regulator of RNase III) [Balneicella halophila]|uniref:O-acetyl-ADP-ribose deacetylase (Regulator of RNase III) n=1 Tax=Balneicella halophila TaxID=1537566 RepID=A0A7L4URC8_BALHA|nr:O-acetyl-ADP-ribose deacetylase [Balneicella halophila]PVX52328.1 O-acetyl-ADP-ribose deacetylase (regulator of RNase III) [Balneicella halophila]
MNLKVQKSDITQLQVDAIVNAANSSLLGGGGVDGAIHRAGGPAILAECKEKGGCPTGEAVITTAGNLPAKKVIHTVGPIWKGGHQNEKELLAECYKNSLELAENHQLKSIAFPNISTGVYGFPKSLAAPIAIDTVNDYFNENPQSIIEDVYFICFDDENYKLYSDLLN